MSRKAAVKELRQNWKILNGDLVEIQKAVLENPSPTMDRAWIRAFAALVEGFLYQLRHVAREEGKRNAILSDDEMFLLSERQVSLNKKGEIQLKNNVSRERLLPMLLFT